MAKEKAILALDEGERKGKVDLLIEDKKMTEEKVKVVMEEKETRSCDPEMVVGPSTSDSSGDNVEVKGVVVDHTFVTTNGEGGTRGLSTISDTLSEQEYSSDSGKGGSGSGCESVILTPPDSVVNENDAEVEVEEEGMMVGVGPSWAVCPGYNTYTAYSLDIAKIYPNVSMIYEFDIPQSVVGRLIGRFGSFVNKIKETTGANILVKRHHSIHSLKICAIEGSCSEIDQAIGMIRKRFPIKQFPSITLQQVNFDGPLSASLSFLPSNNKLNLIEGVINDIAVNCVVILDHIFVQQPTHPTYPALSRLHQALKSVYDQPVGAPKLSRPFNPGVLCVAQLKEDWFRAEVVAIDEEKAQVTARLVDVGGYVQVSIDSLRQIRVDFVTIPFQATECRLANVAPIEEEGWSEEAVNFFKILAQGHVLQATVIDYSARDNITLIHLYKLCGSNTHIFINQEMVNHGYANWIEEAEYYGLSEVDQLSHNFAELGTASSSAASPNEMEMGVSNPSWGDISSSDELISNEAYHEAALEAYEATQDVFQGEATQVENVTVTATNVP